MCKLKTLKLRNLSARINETNQYLLLFPLNHASSNIKPDRINYILLHDVPGGRDIKSYVQGFDFDSVSYFSVIFMFDRT